MALATRAHGARPPLSRRTGLLLAGSALAAPKTRPARAEEEEEERQAPPPNPSGTVTFQVSVDDEPKGALTFDVDGRAAPVAVGRVLMLAAGIPDGGGGYRGAVVDKVDPAFVRLGQRRLGALGGAAGAEAAANIPGGLSGAPVQAEVDAAASVSDFDVILIAPADGDDAETEERLVARGGALVTERSRAKGAPAPPNGTSLIFVLDASAIPPELTARCVKVGSVGDGSARALLRQLGQLPRFEANADSGFFQTAKSIGDVRALVAEASFGKPLAKVKVMSSTATP